MRAKILRSRDDLINIICGKGRLTACNQAIESGTVTVLGGFTPKEITGGYPFWGIHVLSKYGKEWVFAVIPRDTEYQVKELDSIDWESWAGNALGQPSIYNGDDPEKCYYQYLQAIDKGEPWVINPK